MYSIEKKSKIITVLGSGFRTLLIFGVIVFCIEACSKDPVELKKDPPSTTNPPGEGDQGGEQDTIVVPGETLTADVFSNYLILDGATKVNGQPPTALDGQFKINYKDTIYLMNGNPYKARISIFNSEASAITGFNVWVSGLQTPHYYNVPIVEQEKNDSIRTIYIGFDPPEEELTSPITFDIKIQPHGPDGIPMDETIKNITVEQPSLCPIDAENKYAWKWLYTEMYDYTGGLFKLTAPFFSATYSESGDGGGYYYGKCCSLQTDNTYEEAYLGEDGCAKNSPNYKEMLISTPYSLTGYDYLALFKNGAFGHFISSFNVNFSPSNSRICTLFAFYDHDYNHYLRKGNYTFDANNYFQPIIEIADPAFGPTMPYGKMVYSCHLVIFSYGNEEKYNRAYQRNWYLEDGEDTTPPDPEDYLHDWFDF